METIVDNDDTSRVMKATINMIYYASAELCFGPTKTTCRCSCYAFIPS